MAEFKIYNTTSSKMACRGSEKACIGVVKKPYSYLKIIPKGSKVLSVSVWGAGGGTTAYYCEVCMLAVIEQMEKTIAEVKPKPNALEELWGGDEGPSSEKYKDEPEYDDHGASYYEDPPYGCGGY